MKTVFIVHEIKSTHIAVIGGGYEDAILSTPWSEKEHDTYEDALTEVKESIEESELLHPQKNLSLTISKVFKR